MAGTHLRLKRRPGPHLTPLAERIAERSFSDISRRLSGLSPEMSGAEARGYIRARAGIVVHCEVNRILQRERRLRPADRAQLIALATEMVVEGCLRTSHEAPDSCFAA